MPEADRRADERGHSFRRVFSPPAPNTNSVSKQAAMKPAPQFTA